MMTYNFKNSIFEVKRHVLRIIFKLKDIICSSGIDTDFLVSK